MKSIRIKILVSIFFITVITTLAITVVFYQKAADTIEDNYILSNQQRNRQLIESLDQSMQEVLHISVEASCDPELKRKTHEYTVNQKDQTLEEIAEILKIYYKQNAAISSYHLIIPSQQVLVTSEAYPIFRKVIEKRNIEAIIRESQEKAGPFLLKSLISGKPSQLAFVEEVAVNGEVLGYLCANIEERSLYYNYLSEMKTEAVEEVMLLDVEDKIISSDNAEQVGTASHLQVERGAADKRTELVSLDEDNIYFYSRAYFSGCALYISADRESVLGDLTQLRLYYTGIFLTFLLIAAILAFYLAQMIYRPIKQLTTTVKQVSEGNLETRADITSKDEIGTLSEEFNQMLDHIEELIEQVIEKEKLKKDAELEALQYQVTPHFMYNTLNAIKYSAKIKGEQELAGLIENFVELLQASISKKGAFLTVTEELYILENYIRLQEFRSHATIQMRCEISEEAQSCLIPRLLLQPLVENSLLHGIDLKENNGVIKITAKVEEEVLYLEVSDNGRGISQEKIAQLLYKKTKKTKGFTAIGIPNILERLKLYYGERAGMDYRSDVPGTTVIIHLPKEVYDDQEE
ncbi:two-component system sensor histidine kinase YesM [Lachnospiraceae bacterium PF1-21]|uniref:sensor histidine kinase n=1 Tax=Ohessyouella blattaphilus TaxID=2949333 RepID=UPI003E1D7682